MSTLDTQYNEIMAGMKQGVATEKEAARTETKLPDPFLAAQWSLHRTQFDQRPYVRAACGKCKTIVTTGDLACVFNHCGESEPMPEDIRDRLERLQIKLGIRIQTFVDELLGKSRPAPAPAPAPNLNAF